MQTLHVLQDIKLLLAHRTALLALDGGVEGTQSVDLHLLRVEQHLQQTAAKLDKTKGELSVQKIVDELYDWTERRMADAKENNSKADEMLLKRCAYHGLNFSAPFVVMRHWDKMHQEGDYWCGEFETDEVDWQLAELIVTIQYACQRHYFGAMAEKYFDDKSRDVAANVQRRPKTIEDFNRLPEEFTVDDVMRCFSMSSITAARMRTHALGYRPDGVCLYSVEHVAQRSLPRLPQKGVGAALCAESTPCYLGMVQTLL